jgi:hypothetical protein
MALALLRWEDGATFSFDLGTTNRWYAWAVGDGTTRRLGGIPVLADPSATSDGRIGPLPTERLGRGRFTLPAGALDREHRAVQLASHRDADGRGPAFSRIVRVPIGVGGPTAADQSSPSIEDGLIDPFPTVGGIAMNASPAISHALFLDGLVRALPSALPSLAPLLRPFTGSIGSAIGQLVGNTTVLPTADQITPLLRSAIADEQTRRLVADLVRQTLAAARTAATAPTAATGAPAATTPAGPASATSTHTVAAPTVEAQGYSNAMVAPALLAALPALAPLLQQVLNPETIQAVVNAPNQHLQTVTNGIRDLARVGLESAQQDLDFLKEIHPTLDDPALDALLQSMSVGLSRPTREMRFTRASTVSLRLVDAVTSSIGGRPAVAYAADRPLTFPVVVTTPRPIHQATLEICAKDAASLEPLHTERWALEHVPAGPLRHAPTLPPSVARDGRPLLVTVALAWDTRDGSRRGTSVQQRIELLGAGHVGALGRGSATAVAQDPGAHRQWFPPVWQGTVPDGASRIRIELRHAVGTGPAPAARSRWEGAGRDSVLHLRAATSVNPAGLLRLGRVLGLVTGPDTDPADGPVVRSALRLGGQGGWEVRGRRGATLRLHVTPELRLDQAMMALATDVAPTGNITGLRQERVPAPIPVAVHVLTTSDRARAGKLGELDGRAVVARNRIPLVPRPRRRSSR